MSNTPTSVKPDGSDVALKHNTFCLQNVLPHHTLDIRTSFVKRGSLKHVDTQNRTHYIKLDCSIKDAAGKIVQVFNRFILLDESITKVSLPGPSPKKGVRGGYY